MIYIDLDPPPTPWLKALVQSIGGHISPIEGTRSVLVLSPDFQVLLEKIAQHLG